jgi:hypothetical protein
MVHKKKQDIGIQIENFDIHSKSAKKRKHGKLLPNTIRALICGPSNCGKTNVMASLLIDPNGVRFKNVYVYSKSLGQDKYKFIERAIERVGDVKFYGFNDNDAVIDPEEAKHDSVFIFDDVACEKQDKIRNYFCMGRHNSIDSFYLCQTYSKIPKQLVRDNANMLILFKMDDTNLRHVYDDHVNTDMSLEMFRQICSECWKDNYGFLVIVKDDDIANGRYRSRFDTFILP